MKRILSLVLSLLLVFGLVGCKDEENTEENSIDIEYYANLGQIPESEYILGDTGDTIKAALEEKQKESEENDGHYFFTVQEGENNVLITDGTYEYYYKKAAPEKGIVYMVSYTDAYGFKLGDVVLEVEKALKDYGVKEESVTAENAFFYMGNYENSTLLRATFEKNTVMFIFEDNALCATVIYSNENWN